MFGRGGGQIASATSIRGERFDYVTVGIYAYNGPEFVESLLGAFRARVAPFNVNYRYGPEEIAYLLDNADAEAVVFEAGYAAIIDEVRTRLPLVKRWIAIARDGHPVPDWAVDYAGIAPLPATVAAPWGRSDSSWSTLARHWRRVKPCRP